MSDTSVDSAIAELNNLWDSVDASEEEFTAALRTLVLAEQERCCGLVFGHCGSDNVAQRTVDAIRGARKKNIAGR